MKRFFLLAMLALSNIACPSVLFADTIQFSITGVLPIEDGTIARKIGSSVAYTAEIVIDTDAETLKTYDWGDHRQAYYPFEKITLFIGESELVIQGKHTDQSYPGYSNIWIQDGDRGTGWSDQAWVAWNSSDFQKPLEAVRINGYEVYITGFAGGAGGSSSTFSGTSIDRVSYLDTFSSSLASISLEVGSLDYFGTDWSPMLAVSSEKQEGDGYVVMIDGMKPVSTFLDILPNAYTTYLYSEVPSSWMRKLRREVGKVFAYSWSNDISDTSETTNRISSLLEGLSRIAKRNGGDLVLIAHSWGNVLTYAAVMKNDAIKIDKFISLGSPLNSQTEIVDLYTTNNLLALNVSSTIKRRPKNIREWQNYWYECDSISGPIDYFKWYRWVDATGVDNIELDSRRLGVGCHSDYFDDSPTWDTILEEATR